MLFIASVLYISIPNFIGVNSSMRNNLSVRFVR